jgi:hypothetical protein
MNDEGFSQNNMNELTSQQGGGKGSVSSMVPYGDNGAVAGASYRNANELTAREAAAGFGSAGT